MFPAAFLDDLNRFARLVWGNPQALLRRLPPHGVKFIDLGEYFNALQSLFPGILQHDKILVREEYHATLQALQTCEYRRGAYVTGQPGIGKSYFLVYALVYFLGKKEPVALQPLNDAGIYLLFKEDVALYSMKVAAPLLKCSLVWALSDANADIQIPPVTFRVDGDRIRVIQTTLPQASYYRQWSKQHGASCYIMDIWTEEEVENLATLFRLDVERMATLARKWGPVPRALLQYIDQEDSKIEAWYRRCSKRAIVECSAFVDGGVLLNIPDPPSMFYIIRPRKIAGTGVVSHGFSDVTVPTRTLRKLLAEGLQRENNKVRLEFYRALSEHTETCRAADFIYESWFHCFVSAGHEIRCQWVVQGTDDDIMMQFKLPTTLRGTCPTNTVATQDASSSHIPPFYWVPPLGYLLGIDSALVLEKEIFVFQVTAWAYQTMPLIKRGLQKLHRILPENLKGLPWRVVFVGTEHATMKVVARTWASKLSFPMQGTNIPVGWFAVDPVQYGVVYRAYRDESDPVLTEFDQEVTEVKED